MRKFKFFNDNNELSTKRTLSLYSVTTHMTYNNVKLLDYHYIRSQDYVHVPDSNIVLPGRLDHTLFLVIDDTSEHIDGLLDF
jgi:hypothetical protein